MPRLRRLAGLAARREHEVGQDGHARSASAAAPTVAGMRSAARTTTSRCSWRSTSCCKPIRFRVPKQAINAGICYITEDRKLNGFFETMRIDDNIYISRLATRRGFRLLLSRPVTRHAGHDH